MVTPLLSFVLADAKRLVVIACCSEFAAFHFAAQCSAVEVVPHALLEFSRSVLQGTFASVVQKQAARQLKFLQQDPAGSFGFVEHAGVDLQMRSCCGHRLQLFAYR